MRFVSIGECMVELSGAGEDLWRSGFAGDTFNTAWYARALMPVGQVDYVTTLGSDAVSDRMVAFMRGAGIGTDHIRRDPVRSPGLYMISLTDGERSFTYWRDSSAARGLADDPVAIARAVDGADLVYLSGITLAILTPERRAALWSVLDGKRIAFDPNLRPRLWQDTRMMCDVVSDAASRSAIVLPSFDDEAAHFGDATPLATLARYRALGAAEIVVKNGGAEMVVLSDGQTQTIAGGKVAPVDTTGAGDSFNGAYLAGRLRGMTVSEAAAAAHRTAQTVIGQRGALLPFGDIT